jgi:fibronectin-binding autotransporter adhesin
MTTSKRLTRYSPHTNSIGSALVAFAMLSMHTSPSSAQTATWSGGAATLNWSDPAAFTPQPPGPSANVVFGQFGVVGAPGLVNNVVDQDVTISTLGYNALIASGYHTTLINPGHTLSIVPQAGQGTALAIGSWAGSSSPALGTSANDQVYATILGTNANLVVNGPTATIRIEQDHNSSGSHNATLDLSGLGTFSALVSNILIGADWALQRDVGTLILAQTNTITTASMGTNLPGVLLGRANTDGGYGVLTLGRVNVFNTDWLAVGGYRADQLTNQLSFGAGITNASFTLRSSTGGRALALSAGDFQAYDDPTGVLSTSRKPIGNIDLRGGTVDILVDAIYLGRNLPTNDIPNNGATGLGTGILSFDSGKIDVNNLWLGCKVGTNWAGAAGTMNLSGTATLNVNSNLILSYRAYANGNNATATLTVSSNAVANIYGNITKGSGSATINLTSGGLLNLQPSGAPTRGSLTVDTLNLNGGVVSNGVSLTAGTLAGSGTIVKVSQVTNSGNLALGSGLSAGTMSIDGNFTLQTNTPLSYILSGTGTTGGGTNSYLAVGGDLNFSGANILSFIPLASPAAAVYRLADYGGSLTGFPILTNATRYNLGLDLSTPGQINLTNGGGAALSLTWKGAAGTGGTNWDLKSTPNWNGNVFYQADAVTFDATSLTSNINVLGLLYPQSITVNSVTNYFFVGSGKLSGGTGITKNGAGTLFINNSGGNDFTGSITINAGILKVGRADAFGSTNGGTTIAAGAMLDLNGVSCYSPGETITISGTGVTNAGAIINSGSDTAGQNGLRYVVLADNASIGNSPGRWDIRGPGGSGSFSGGLYLNGFTLTKSGPGKNALVDIVATDAGSIVVANGTLTVTRSIVDGPGSISLMNGAIFQFENFGAGYVAKPLIVNGTATLAVTNTSAPYSTPTLFSPITNLGSLTIDTPQNLTLTNVLSGAGALTKTSAGSLILQAPDTCTGPTTISAGSLVLSAGSSLPNTRAINLASNTTLNVSAITGLTLGAGQNLSGSGTVVGNLTAGRGAAIGTGSTPATLTVSSDLALNGSTNLVKLGGDPTQVGNGANDLIVAGHDLTLNGANTIQITPLAPLSSDSPYTIAVYTNTLHGGLANLTVTSASPRYTFNVVDPATTPNSIQVAVTGVPAWLTWSGGRPGSPTLWDTSITLNWLDHGLPDLFYVGDSVLFDDSGLANQVTLVGQLQPASIVVSNSLQNYTFAGSGGLTAGSLIKQEAGTLTLANTGVNAFSLGIALNEGTLILNFPADATLDAALSDDGSGNGTLQKQGTNTVTLSGNSPNFNGTILVSAGTLKAGSTNGLGSITAGTTVIAGATLDINGFNLGAEPITIIGDGVGGLGALVNNSTPDLQDAVQDVTLAGDATVGGAHRWDLRNRAGTDCFLRTSFDSCKLTKIGPNQVSLVNATIDSGLGDIDVRQGILSFEYNTMTRYSDGLGDPSRTISVFSNAFLLFNQLNNALQNTVVLQDGATVTNENGDNYISGPVSLNGSNVFNIAAGSLTLSTPLAGNGSINKFGGGTLDLWTDNTNTGAVCVNGGTLMLSSSLALGTNRNILVTTSSGGGGQTGTRITLDGSKSGGVTIPPGVSVNLPSSGSGDLRSMLYTDSGLNEWQGPIAFNGSGTVNIIVNSGAQLTLSGSISGSLTNLAIRGTNNGFGRITGPLNLGAARFQKTETSTWVLATNNNTWGDTLLSNGTLQLGTNNACPSPTTITFGEPGLIPMLDLNGFDQQVAGLISAGDPANDFIGNSSSSSDSTLIVAGTNSATFGGSIMDTVPVPGGAPLGSRRVALTLASGNSGTLTLSGVNTYTGPTSLNGGTLLVSGSLSNTAVTVNTGATLAGTGLILGPAAIQDGGTLALGPAIGRLTISNNLSFSSGSMSVAKVNLDAATNDSIGGLATLTYGGTLVVTNLGHTTLTNGTVLKLFDAAAYSGGFSAILPFQPGARLIWDSSRLTTDGTLRIVASTPLQFQQLSRLPDRNIRLMASGPAGHPWSLYASTNVALPFGNWTLLSTGIVTVAPFTIDDLAATNYSSRFYRLSAP